MSFRGSGATLPADLVEAAGAQDLGPELVHMAWELARLAMPAPADASAPEERALLLVALALLAAQRDGSTRVPLAAAGGSAPLERLLVDLGATPSDRTAVDGLLARAAAGDARLRPLFGGAGDYRPLLRVGDHLYAQRLWELERRVAARLRELLPAPATNAPAAVSAALADVRERPARDAAGRPVPLSDEQEAAVQAALGGRLTAITGGPGSGKTWIVAALLRVVARLGDPALAEIALAAPTGKAADRLQASLRAVLETIAAPAEADRSLLASPPAASTLHRLLSYSPSGERFLHHERNPLAERLVLVDESSMVDLALADRLLRSLPAGGRLVLLGDARQLPSVEAGAVFRDLVAAAPEARVARLTRSWRMDPSDAAGSAILALAAWVTAGGADAAAPVAVRQEAGEITFAGAELLPVPPTSLGAFLERWWMEQVRGLPGWPELVAREWAAPDGVAAAELPALAGLFTHLESHRLLTATRGWSAGTGVTALNAWFRAALLRDVPGLQRAQASRAANDAAEPLPGEPVLVTRNDYRRGLFNGDQGVVLRVAAEGAAPAAMVVLRAAGGFRALPLAALRGTVEPAWATTVHKAQGSEHDQVGIVLPASESRLLTRELLYTAITRARRGAVLVGAAERLAAAAARGAERWSGIAEALQATSQPSPPGAAPSAAQLPLPF